MSQIEWLYDCLQDLKTETLVKIIDELNLGIQDNEYKGMATDVYNKAKTGVELSYRQKRVLVNIIGQPRY